MKRTILLLGLLLGLCSPCYGTECILNVARTGQEESQWCWNACSECIIEFCGGNVDQEDIAQWACSLAGWCNDCNDCVCPHPCGGCCDQPNYLYETTYSIAAILWAFGDIGSSGMADYMTREQILEDVCPPKCAPFVIRFYWYENGQPRGGHVVVGHGFDSDNDLLHYMDPWPVGQGSFGIFDYDWVVEGSDGPYQYDHKWTGSLRLPTSCQPVAVPGLSAAGLIVMTLLLLGSASVLLVRRRLRLSQSV